MGKGLANPIGQIEAGSLLLRHLGQIQAADAIVTAINKVIGRKSPNELTRDLGGTASTKDLGNAILHEVRQI